MADVSKIKIGSTTYDIKDATARSKADANTTYTLSKSGSTITLTGSDGKTSSVTDDNTTYTSLKSPMSLDIIANNTDVACTYDGSSDGSVAFKGGNNITITANSDNISQGGDITISTTATSDSEIPTTTINSICV